MPLYDFCCTAGHEFAVVKHMSEYDPKAPVTCDCGAPASRDMSKSQSSFYGAKVEDAHFSPVLGRVVSSNKEVQREARSRGMIEVGTEKPETLHKHFERQREETRVRRYEDAARVKLYDS